LLHTNLELFKTDSKTDSFTTFSKEFSADKETERIAADLERYPELRSTMEKLVPAEVEYKPFWIRYYFLRNELDLEEKKRKELLKGAINEEEEVGWDEDDSEDEEEDGEEEEESEEEEEKAPEPKKPVPKASTDTLQPKPKVSTSNDRSSQSDSEASYDVVSGAPSKTGSPPGGKVRNYTREN
jgi:glucan-binding YG repeat protein